MNAIEQALATLQGSPDFKVLRRFDPPRRYCAGVPGEPKVGLIVDTETTGLDDDDKIIQFAALPFVFDREGLVYEVGDPYVGLEDPCAPLSPEVVEITGITDEMLKGQTFDTAFVTGMAEAADIVIAHHARFDRPKTELRFPAFVPKPWVCSMNDIRWRAFGVRSAALDYLLANVARVFHTEHRADSDCQSVLHILASPILEQGRYSYLHHLLEAARRPTFKIMADPPYGHNKEIKARGYRAFYKGSKFQYWWIEVEPEDCAAEEEWLVREIGCDPTKVHTFRVTAKTRYSLRDS